MGSSAISGGCWGWTTYGGYGWSGL